MKNIQLIGSLLASSILVGCGGDSGGSDAGPVSHAPVINSITATEEYFIDDVVQLTVVVTDEDTPLEALSITYSTGSSEVLVTDKDQEVIVTVADDEHQTVDTITIPAGVKNGNLNPIRSPYDHVETKVALFNAIAEQTGSDIVIETNENGDYFVIVDEETYILSDLTEEEVYELIDIINDGVEGAPNVRPIDGSPVTIPTITAITLDGGTTLGAQVFVVVDAHDEDGDDLTVTYNSETSNEFAVGREDQLVKVDVTDGTYLVSQSIVIPKAQDDVLLPEPIEGEPSPIAPVIESTTQSGGIYVGDKVTLSVVVTDEDTPLEDITVTYSTPTGTNELARTDSDQVITISVLDGTYLIKKDITVVAGEPLACEEGEVCLPVGDIPEPHDRLIDPIEGSPVTAPVIHSVTLDGGIYLNDVVKVIVDATDEDGSELTVTYNEQASNVFAVGREAQVIDIKVTDGTYLVSQSITIPEAVDDEFIPTPIDPTPAPIAPVIESITQSGGEYQGEYIALEVKVTDGDTPIEDVIISYSTGSNEVLLTEQDQTVIVTVFDGLFEISQTEIVNAGKNADIIVEPYPGNPIHAPVIDSISFKGGILLGDEVTVVVEASDSDDDSLVVSYNGRSTDKFVRQVDEQIIVVSVTDGTYVTSESVVLKPGIELEVESTVMDGLGQYDTYASDVYLSADGQIMIVPDTANDDLGKNSGVIYIYESRNGEWLLVSQLASYDGSSHSVFGSSVALSDDNSTLAVLAESYEADNGKTYMVDAAYVYRLNRELVPTLIGKAIVSGDSNDSTYTRDLALSGNGAILAVGSVKNEAVYLYQTSELSTESPTYEYVRVKNQSGLEDLNFAYQVDIDSKGEVLAVSAPRYAELGNKISGAVFLYDISDLENAQVADETLIRPEEPLVNDINQTFGGRIDLSADGRWLASSLYSGETKGSAYIFETTTLEQKLIESSDGQSGDYFSSSIAINSSGSRIAIGAVAKGIRHYTRVGAVYIYDTATLTELKLTPEQYLDTTEFGKNISFNATGDKLVSTAEFDGHEYRGTVFTYTVKDTD